jgi:hypothetical protein
VSARVTTAHDLGRILYLLDSAALADRRALQKTGLTQHEARFAVDLLLSSQSRGDNVGLFRPAVGPTLPVAQKNGWLLDARHTAAIIFRPEGPRIVVLVTYKPGIDLSLAQTLGRRLMAALR